MSKTPQIIAITNRHLVRGNYQQQIEKIVKAGIDGLLLREKDLSPAAYTALAREVLAICATAKVPCILHTFAEVAQDLAHPALHVPLPQLVATPTLADDFPLLGVSTHSLAEAQLAHRLGASYITWGHILPTACKPGVPAKGLAQLKKVVEAVALPVYALGGIKADSAGVVSVCGVDGLCLMSGLMGADDPAKVLYAVRHASGA